MHRFLLRSELVVIFCASSLLFAIAASDISGVVKSTQAGAWVMAETSYQEITI